MNNQTQPGGPGLGPSAESTLLTLAILFFVAVILSAVTLVPRGSGGNNSELASSSGGVGNTNSSGGDDTATDDSGATTGGGNIVAGGGTHSSGSTSGAKKATTTKKAGTTGAGSSSSGTSGGAGSGTSGSGGTTSGGTRTGGGTTGGTSGGGVPTGGGGTGGSDAYAPSSCDGGKGGATDTGVTDNQILLGAVTVDSGPGATFLQPEDTSMQAVVNIVNNNGGICGRELKLLLHDSGWDAQTGARYIQNLVEGDKVFALVVNPDSEGLDAASNTGYLDDHKVPVLGTDGLLYSQYQDPMIWPIAASTVTAMHAIAHSQAANGSKHFSLVYERTYRFGREGANAYDHAVKDITGSDIPGYVNPDTNPQCLQAFCGIEAGKNNYGSDANQIKSACVDLQCDAGAVLLEPTTAITWFSSGGRFGGVVDPGGGKGAAPQPLFETYFANGCQSACDGMRLWTGFKPNIAQFASEEGVQQYVNDLTSYQKNADPNNQFAEGAYLGMRLAVAAIGAASVSSTGLTRATVATLLDNTKGFDIGLTVAPLSWSKGDHFAEARVHAFDESYKGGFNGWQYIQGSEIEDSDPTHI